MPDRRQGDRRSDAPKKISIKFTNFIMICIMVVIIIISIILCFVFYNKGYNKGSNYGYSTGYVDGYNEGYLDWLNENANDIYEDEEIYFPIESESNE